MPSAIQPAKVLWLRNVLGIELASTLDAQAGESFHGKWQAAVKTWEAAADDVSAQITKLQGVLREANDETLTNIAEFGLNGVTGNHLVPLRAAFIDVSRSGDDIPASLREKTADLVDDFQDHLKKDRRVQLAEENPFHIHIPISARLLPALDGLAAVLAATG